MLTRVDTRIRDAAPALLPSSSVASTRQRGVLVVVSDAGFATKLRNAVGDAGYRPTVVNDPSAARELLDAGLDPCVVLVALGADAEGREFIRRHNADPRTAGIPVIFFSSGDRTHAPTPIVSALVAFVERYCHAASSERG